jgi:hypothetical protein
VLAMQVRLRAIIQIMESLYWVSGSTGGKFIESCGICGLAWVYLQEPVEDDMRAGRGATLNRGVDGGARPGTQTLHGPQ